MEVFIKTIQSIEKQLEFNAQATIFSAVKGVCIWKSFDLDFIVNRGNKFLQEGQVISVDYLPLSLENESNHIKVTKHGLYSDIFNTVDFFFNHQHSTSEETVKDVIFICVGFSFAINGIKKLCFCSNLTVETKTVLVLQMDSQFSQN